MEHIKKQIERQHTSQKYRDKNLAKRKAYEKSVIEQKMNVNQKIGLLSSIQQGLGGVGTAINALSEQYPV